MKKVSFEININTDPMVQIPLLRVATKDRPPVFQRIVLSLFVVALFTVAFCMYQKMQPTAKETTAAQPNQSKPGQQPWGEASLFSRSQVRK